MITLVLDADGNTLHDCVAQRCDTSWDGEPLSAAVEIALPTAADITATNLPAKIDAALWIMDGNTARLRSDAAA